MLVKTMLLWLVGTMVALTAIPPAAASYIAEGHPAPSFKVKSGDDQNLSLDMLRGKVIVLFYENKDALKKNLELKNELKSFYRQAPQALQNQVFRLVVIDCTTAVWPVLPIWKSKLRDGSRKEGMTIYGDWDGSMQRDYGMQPEDSNFLIIDPQGLVRFNATGKVAADRIPNIKALLKDLVLASQTGRGK